jgi:hypothetical protein
VGRGEATCGRFPNGGGTRDVAAWCGRGQWCHSVAGGVLLQACGMCVCGAACKQDEKETSFFQGMWC